MPLEETREELNNQTEKKNNKGQIIPTQVATVDILVSTPFSLTYLPH